MAAIVFNRDPVAFSVGEPIPTHRFTREAMESFLKQPVKSPIQTAR
jgi:hypothetical protein